MTDALFTPVALGAMRLTHRVILAPMTRLRAEAAVDAEKIPALVAMFRRGAQLAAATGFDGVESHAATFLQDGTNKRTEAYGADLADRCRFFDAQQSA